MAGAGAAGIGAAGLPPATLLQHDPAGRAVMGDGTPTRGLVLRCLSLHSILQFRATCKRSRAVIADFDCAHVRSSIPPVSDPEQLVALHRALPRVRGLQIEMNPAEYIDSVLSGGFTDSFLQVSGIDEESLSALGGSMRHLSLYDSGPFGEYSFKSFGKLVSLSLQNVEAGAATFGFLTSLRHLKYGHTTSIPAEGLRTLAPRLHTLELASLEEEVQLPVMPQLRRLALSRVRLADALLPRLPLLSELDVGDVDLRYEPFTDGVLWPMVATHSAAPGQWVAQATLRSVGVWSCPQIRRVPTGIRHLSCFGRYATDGSDDDDVEELLLTPDALRTVETLHLDEWPFEHPTPMPNLHTLSFSMDDMRLLGYPLSAAQLALCPSLHTISAYGDPIRLRGQQAIEQWKQAIKNLQYIFMPFRAVDTEREDGTLIEHNDLSLLQYVRCLKGVDLSALPWATNAMLMQLRQLEYLDITRGTGITVAGLGQLSKLKVLRMGVQLKSVKRLIDQLVPFILAAPALVVIELEVYSGGKGAVGQLKHQSEHEADVANRLIAALRPRLAAMGPDGSPIRVSEESFESLQSALGPPFSTWKRGTMLMASSCDVCVAIHRAELANWSGPSMVDWHAEEAGVVE